MSRFDETGKLITTPAEELASLGMRVGSKVRFPKAHCCNTRFVTCLVYPSGNVMPCAAVIS